MSDFLSMFDYTGKTAKVLGKSKINIYKDIYTHLSDKQNDKTLPADKNYLGNNELAQNIYKEKYYIKDLNNNLINCGCN